MNRFGFCVSIFMFFGLIVSGQESYEISQGGTYTINCDEEYIIFSEGFVANQVFEITFCIEPGSAPAVQAVLSPELLDHYWDLTGTAALFLYTGSSWGPFLGNYNTENDPNGFVVTSVSGCMTVVLITGSDPSGTGFELLIRCAEAQQPFFIDLNSNPEFQSTPVDSNSVTLCFSDTFSLSAITYYPYANASGNGYAQSDETSLFIWTMGNGTVYQGFGLTEITHSYNQGSGYVVQLTVVDAEGFVELAFCTVVQHPPPIFNNVIQSDTLCIGESTSITGGINVSQLDTMGFMETGGAVFGKAFYSGQAVLEDEFTSCTTTTLPINVGGFGSDQILSDPADIFSITVNTHHEWIGGLEIGVVCPNANDTVVLIDMNNGQSSCPDLFSGGFPGGEIVLGEPQSLPLSLGYNYSWTENTPDYGSFSQEYQNASSLGVFPEGIYLPETAFEQLLGCPLNGEWQLIINDDFQGPTGSINYWSIYFNPQINPQTYSFDASIVAAGWDEQQGLTVNSDSTSVNILPAASGDNFYTFFVIDEFGCRSDTTIHIYSRPDVEIEDETVCDLSFSLQATNAPDSGVYTVLEQPANSNLSFEAISSDASAELSVDQYGIYIIELTENNCSYRDTAVIDFRPNPQTAELPADTALCMGASILLDAGPQLPNSDNFIVNWFIDGDTIFNGTYDLTVNQPGQYMVEITGFCGTAIDTANVFEINLDFKGTTICSRQATGSVDIIPEGTGIWSANSPDISFSASNQLNTTISSSNFGAYEITFADNRCPKDGISRIFRFVEQPSPEIIPENPNFCVEEDSLTLSTKLTENNTGTYFWSLNGEMQISQNDSLVFPPLYFQPLQDYRVDLIVQDPYNVCPPGEESISFTGQWCTYEIPNVFTPNGDGRNDRFHILFLDYFPEASIRIYDRWGLLVFEQNNYDRYQEQTGSATVPGGWDAANQPNGTYLYELLLPSIQQKESGYVQVLR